MQDLQKHEQFEIEVLKFLHDRHVLDRMVFFGGTALRLCYALPRYSVDLDLWLIEEDPDFFKTLKTILGERYTLLDGQNKYYTYLFEIKSGTYPNRLKIEVRKSAFKDFFYDWAIAFSTHAMDQVKLKCATLESLFEMKKQALLDRQEIRDAYDLEFLLRRLGKVTWGAGEKELLLKAIQNFKPVDFQSKLGSLLPKEERNQYASNRFIFLESQLRA